VTLASVRDEIRASLERSKTELRIDDYNAMRQTGCRAALEWVLNLLEADPQFKLPERIAALIRDYESDPGPTFPKTVAFTEVVRRLHKVLEGKP
jgi:hypothetical protein